MSKQKAKASKEQITAYLKMLGNAAKGLNPSELDLDKGCNLINTTTGEIEFNFSGLSEANQKLIAPPISDEENDFLSTVTDAENENEFESTSDRVVIVDFWDYQKEPKKVGLFLGDGRAIGTGAKRTETFLFVDENERYFIVPKWASMEHFKTANNTPQYKYQLIYEGLIAPKSGGSPFHKVTVNKAKAPASIQHTKDLTKLLEPLS